MDDNEDNHEDQPSDVDEDAGVGEDDGEEAEGVAARWHNHQRLSSTNPDEQKDEDEEVNFEDDYDGGSGYVANPIVDEDDLSMWSEMSIRNFLPTNLDCDFDDDVPNQA